MKQKKLFIVYGTVLSLLVLLVGGFFVYKTIADSTEVDKSAIKKDAYYSIRNNATKLQKELYEDLIESVKSKENKKEMYELLAKNYVADFYTWTNKFRRNDVGGIQFVDDKIRVNVYQKAQNEIYNDLYYYLENGGLKETLEVVDFNVISSKMIDYFIIEEDGEEELYDEYLEKYVDGNYHDAYEVKLTWTYETQESFNSNAYETSANIIMVLNERDIPMIIEVNHEEEN